MEGAAIGCAAFAWRGRKGRLLSHVATPSAGFVPEKCGLIGAHVRSATVPFLIFFIFSRFQLFQKSEPFVFVLFYFIFFLFCGGFFMEIPENILLMGGIFTCYV